MTTNTLTRVPESPNPTKHNTDITIIIPVVVWMRASALTLPRLFSPFRIPESYTHTKHNTNTIIIPIVVWMRATSRALPTMQPF